jgi:hypothetical protein
MKDSIKANLIVFLIIAVIAFTISSAFASLTITEDNDSYKLSSIENDSFEPNYIDEVPTIIPKVETNNTDNSTNTTTNDTYDTNDTWNGTFDLSWEN